MIPRKLSYLDALLVTAHLLCLNSEDRRLRFGINVSNDFIRKYVRETIDSPTSQWFAIQDDSMLVALCHVAIYDNGDAELGFSVDEEHRNKGYAQILFDRAITWLRTNGVTNVFMHCLSQNAAMKHIANKNGMTVITEIGESNAQVKVEPASVMTSVTDAYYDKIALFDMIYKNSYKFMKNFTTTI
jgi:RimJ/RimL family protein N-acetyltransferase